MRANRVIEAALVVGVAMAGSAWPLPPPTRCPSCWVPPLFTSWQIQFSGTLDQAFNATLYEIDMFDTPSDTVTGLHAAGRKVICYVDAGTWEDFRPVQIDPHGLGLAARCAMRRAEPRSARGRRASRLTSPASRHHRAPCTYAMLVRKREPSHGSICRTTPCSPGIVLG